MQLSTATPGPQPQGIYLRRAVHPVVWALLFSCAVHGVLLLQTFFFKTSQPPVDKAKVLVLQWRAPPPPIPMPEVTVSTLASSRQPMPTKRAQPTTKPSAQSTQQSALRAEESGPMQDSTPSAAPSISPSESPPADAGTRTEPSLASPKPQLDLSQSSLARAATQASASSLAYKARVHSGFEPEPQARVFAKRIAAATIPSCWSHTQDGEGQPLAAPSGNLLLLPFTARDAFQGKCKVMP
jgi:hypothetical protein